MSDVEDIHLSVAEFKQLLPGIRESGAIRIAYNPMNGLHAKIIDAMLDAKLLDEEPAEGDDIQFSADFNVFMMNVEDVQNLGPAADVAPEEQPQDPGAAGGRRSRLHKKTRRAKRKSGHTVRR